MSIEIRRAGEGDSHLLDHYDPDIFDEAIVPQRLAAYLASAVNLMVLAVDGDRAVGQCMAVLHTHPDQPNSLYIDNLGVAPSHQRRGIARQLIENAFEWGREKGCTVAWVTTELDNDPALALYSGFKGEAVQSIAYYTFDL